MPRALARLRESVAGTAPSASILYTLKACIGTAPRLVELAHFRIGIKIGIFLGKERSRGQPSLRRHETSSRHGQRQERERCPHITACSALLAVSTVRLSVSWVAIARQQRRLNPALWFVLR